MVVDPSTTSLFQPIGLITLKLQEKFVGQFLDQQDGTTIKIKFKGA
jgi:hypothetical protein